MFKRIVTGALVFGMAAAAPPALAQASCGMREVVVGQLDARYGERLAATGLSDQRHLVELWITPDGATWTLLLSRADGLSCLLDSGSARQFYRSDDATDVGG